jgi:6-phosphogluconolactonase
MILYVGTYSVRGSEGIYVLDFEAESGRLRIAGVTARLRNPSFLALHPREPWLYAVCEEDAAGAVAAVALAGASPGVILNHQPTRGMGPCHVAADPRGEFVAAANYRSGSVSLFPLGDQGRLEPVCDLAQHSGSGPVADRQEGPHAHSVNFDPTGRFLIAPDLGIDRIMVYELDRAAGKLRLHVPGGEIVHAGAGPRHFTFHPHGPWAYLINELDNTVIAYRWEAEAGRLQTLQALSTLPEGFAGTSYCADIHVHSTGRFLYGSNRGHDSLAVFTLDAASGLLEPRGHVPTGGDHPRNFTISPNGAWLLAANMNSDNIVVFRIADDRSLSRVGEPLSLPSPVCLVFGG